MTPAPAPAPPPEAEATGSPGPPPPRSRKLPLFTQHALDWLSDWVPDVLTDPFRDRQRKLMAMERRLQRRFLTEWRGQVGSMEPVLRQRGELVGRAIVDAFVGSTSASSAPSAGHVEVTYDDAAAAAATSAPPPLFKNQAAVADMMLTLDPIIAPVLHPFVEGLKTPINEKLATAEGEIVRAIVGVAAVSLATGFVVGRVTAGWGSGGSGGRGGRR